MYPGIAASTPLDIVMSSSACTYKYVGESSFLPRKRRPFIVRESSRGPFHIQQKQQWVQVWHLWLLRWHRRLWRPPYNRPSPWFFLRLFWRLLLLRNTQYRPSNTALQSETVPSSQDRMTDIADTFGPKFWWPLLLCVWVITNMRRVNF